MSNYLKPSRYFTSEIFEKHLSPYDAITWEKRTASLTNAKGETIFEQKDVEVPNFWSATATNIVASKYFHGKLGSEDRESSVKAMVERVSHTITKYGLHHGYFDTESAQVFEDELAFLLLNQYAAFNSPVWFNVGCHAYEPLAQAGSWHWDPLHSIVRYENSGYLHPQCSACFIQAVDDSMEGIMTLARNEALLFKFGSGSGTNFSSLRSSKEGVSGGGKASGPLSFMRGLDAFAGVIKSGGKTRRAAKMAVLNVNHPDIEEFIDCKLLEDKKAQALMREGYDGSSGPDSEAYSSVFYQNANNSISVTDEFMKAYESGHYYDLLAVTDGRIIESLEARKVMHKLAKATWACGDPGLQYADTINKWHTCKTSGRINASNPCSEYLFLDDSACNLASLNLLRFVRPNGEFDDRAFRKAVVILTIAQDILVDLSGYPTEQIAKNSHDFRPLGLGYANLGALLMNKGWAYDSDKGRNFAAAITALMTGQAYVISMAMARTLSPMLAADKSIAHPPHNCGTFPAYQKNRESFLDVMRMHKDEVYNLGLVADGVETLEIVAHASDLWKKVLDSGEHYGFRNAQVTVLAPTGTIGFLMDCATTGIEPELALIRYKKMVGGGYMKLVNENVGLALDNLGYDHVQVPPILQYIDENGTIEGAPGFKEKDLPVFDTSFKPTNGTRFIAYSGHIKMMAAVQPFLSGAISKTVNMPNEATPEEIEQVYVDAWKLGLKAVAIYRDGSKSNQVLVTKKDDEKKDQLVGSIFEQQQFDQVEITDRLLLNILKQVKAENLSPDMVHVMKELLGVPTAAVAELVKAALPLEDLDAPPIAVRHRLPNKRQSITYKFAVAGHEGYLTVGLYKNGQPGEVFITMAKEGSTISGLMDAFATVFSIALQHGAPLETFVSKLEHMRFEPSGWTGDPEIGYAKSIVDYLARLMRAEFLEHKQGNLFPGTYAPSTLGLGVFHNTPNITQAVVTNGHFSTSAAGLATMVEISDSPACPECGAITVRNGSCYKCLECGATTGCS